MRRACERYASAGSRQRTITTFSSNPSGTVCVLSTNKDNERKHTKPFRTRLRWFETTGTAGCTDENKAKGNRILALSHSFESSALWGLRLASQRSLAIPPSHFFGFDLAPAELEKGVRYSQDAELKDPGLDIVMTMNPKTESLPRYPFLGLNVKASKGSDRSVLVWYSPRIDALALNLHVGRWPVTNNGNESLHDVYKRAVETDRGTQQLLAFVERNIEPFGDYLLRQVANGMYLAKWRMEGNRFGKRDRCIRMLPPEGKCRDRLYEQVNQLCSVFEASGIQPTWRYNRQPEDDAHYQFLPTTPLQ